MSMRTATAEASRCSIRCTDEPASRVLSVGPRSGGSWWGSAVRTTVRSVSVAEQRVCDLHRYLDPIDIVHTHDVRAVQHARCYSRGRCELDLSVRRFPKE